MALNIYPSFGKKEEELSVEKPVRNETSIYPTVSKPVVQKPITPVVTPTQTPTTPNKNVIQSIIAPVPKGLDAGVVLLQRAIRQHESGNRQVIPGEGAELGGASLYQYTKGTWSSVAKKYLGDANAPMTVANENKATYLRIKDWRDKGMKPEQIASMWNAGEGKPNAYAEGMSGVNKYGVKYDVPAYVNRIMNTFRTAAEEYKKTNPTVVTEQKPKESQIYEQNQIKAIKQKISDPETKKLIDSGKVSIAADGSVSLSEDYKKEIKSQFEQVQAERGKLITTLSGYPGVTDQDLQVVRSAFDKGDSMRLNAAIQRIQIGAQLEGKDKVNFLSWADGMVSAVDKLFEAPVLKQFKQGVGLAVGSLGAIENGIINTVGTQVTEAIGKIKKGQIPSITPSKAAYQAGLKGAKEGFKFGQQIGEEGAKASIYAPMGVIPNLALAVPQVISGGTKLGTGIETEDEALKQEGALDIGLGIAGALPFYSGKMKSNLLIDRDFFNLAKREADAIRAGVKNVPRETVVNNIFDKKIANEIDSKFDSAIKPSFTGRKTTAMTNKYNENKHNAIMSIVDNKDNLKLIKDGEEVVGQLPENVEQLSHSVDQTLSKVFKEYDALKEQAGGAGVQIDTKNVAEKMLEIVNDPKFKAWEDYNPGTVNYLMDLTARLEKRGTYTPSEAQAMIEELNAGLKAFFRNPNPSDVTKTAINASLAGELRKSMDEAITSATGEGYQALRNKYAQLKTIQDDINRAVNRMANAPVRGLVDSLTSPFAGADVLMGLVTGNPAQIVRGSSIQVLRNIYKKISNPNFRIKKMFNNIETLLKEREQRIAGTTLIEKASKLPVGLSIEDISKEASKYKTVDDFKKAIGIRYRDSWMGNKEKDADRLLKVFDGFKFHGTNAANEIKQNGFKKKNYFNSGIYFSDTPDVALDYAGQNRTHGGQSVGTFAIDFGKLKIKEIPYEQFRPINKGYGEMEDFVNKLKKQGYDGVHEPGGESLVWNVDKLNKLKGLNTVEDIFNEVKKNSENNINKIPKEQIVKNIQDKKNIKGQTTVENMIKGGAILGGGALISSLASDKNKKDTNPQQSKKEAVKANIEDKKLEKNFVIPNADRDAKIPHINGVTIDKIQLPKKTPETIKKITIKGKEKDGRPATWIIESPEQLAIANRIKYISDKIEPKYTNYLLKLARAEGVYNVKQRNDKGNSDGIDRGIFQINDYYHPEVTDEMADNLDFSILWAIAQIDKGRQHRLWKADDGVKASQIIIE